MKTAIASALYLMIGFGFGVVAATTKGKEQDLTGGQILALTVAWPSIVSATVYTKLFKAAPACTGRAA